MTTYTELRGTVARLVAELDDALLPELEVLEVHCRVNARDLALPGSERLIYRDLAKLIRRLRS